MKKIWGIILAAALIIALAGCARIGRPDNNSNGTIINPAPADNFDTGHSSELKTPTRPGEEQIAETVLVDQDGIRITATSLDVSTYGLEYPEMDVTIENNTSSEINIYTTICSINGYRADGYLGADVISPGSTVRDTIEFYFDRGMPEAGSDYAVCFDLGFVVYDANSYDTITTAGPVHLETTAASIATLSYDDSGAVIVDNSDFKITLRELLTEDDGSQYQELFAYNKRNQPITIWAEDVTVNGTALDPYFITDCDSGLYDMDWIYFYQSDLEAAGISDITELGLTIIVYDYDTYDELYNSGPLTVTYDE